MSLGNSTLQLECRPDMRGRVMALWMVAFMGTTPLGGPVIGWIGEHYGPRWSLAVGGLAALAAGIYGLMRLSGGGAPATPVPPQGGKSSIEAS